jgi:hypothetical protein
MPMHTHACLLRTYVLQTTLAIWAQASKKTFASPTSSLQLLSRCANGTRLIFAVGVLTAPD